MSLREVDSYIANGRRVYEGTGEIIDIQLKCTTTKNAIIKDGFVKYDLEVKNYNGMLRRFNYIKANNKGNPLILILFVLPKMVDYYQ